jgi:hypothetical protein
LTDEAIAPPCAAAGKGKGEFVERNGVVPQMRVFENSMTWPSRQAQDTWNFIVTRT